MSEEKKSNKNITQENAEKKKNILKKPLFWIISILISVVTIAVLIFIMNNGSSDSNSKEKIDVSKVKLSLSKDYKFFNNTREEYAAVIIDLFESNNIPIKLNEECTKYYKNKYNDNNCYRIKTNNKDDIILVGNKKNNFNKIIIDDILYNNDKDNIANILYYFAKSYDKDTNKSIFKNNIKNILLSEDNLNGENSISYVHSHIKYDIEDKSIVLTVSEYADNKQFKESDDYKIQIKNLYENKAYNEIKNSYLFSNSKTIDSHNFNDETGLVDVKIKYSDNELTKYTCANGVKDFAKTIIKSNYIGSLQFECVSNNETIYFVKVENINSITEEEIEANMKYFNAEYIQEDNNLENLKNQIVIDYKNSCAEFNYKDVLRNPDSYKSSRAYWFGEVLQVVSKSSSISTYRIGVSCTPYQYIGGYSCPDAIYVTYYGDTSLIEDDMVMMWGTMEGTQTYTTVMGASVTVPKFYAKYIELQ